MNKHQAIGICVFTQVVGVTQVTTASITCYMCTDDPMIGFPYDPACGDYSYSGRAETWDGADTCYITINEGGYMLRGIYVGQGHGDGDCTYGIGYTACYCKGGLCNTESYCSQCGYPMPTPGSSTTIETTTLTTTNPPTTDASTISPDTLTCYQCMGCSSVDSSTPVNSDTSYQSCVTTISLSSGYVIRGGSYDQHPDGECAQHTEIITCWCSTKDLCNDEDIHL
ncbi:unnamed protein product [Meganyctiphanes norvegica]|uniref:Uncharacterized protein n=1 Tax=Meganyctiphanes norvegica TaxID=48144 RepID=A0AAV2PRB2_MEGNR